MIKIEEGIKILGEIINTSLRKERKKDKELEMVPIL